MYVHVVFLIASYSAYLSQQATILSVVFCTFCGRLHGLLFRIFSLSKNLVVKFVLMMTHAGSSYRGSDVYRTLLTHQC
jgi:hypothetical protein